MRLCCSPYNLNNIKQQTLTHSHFVIHQGLPRGSFQWSRCYPEHCPHHGREKEHSRGSHTTKHDTCHFCLQCISQTTGPTLPQGSQEARNISVHNHYRVCVGGENLVFTCIYPYLLRYFLLFYWQEDWPSLRNDHSWQIVLQGHGDSEVSEFPPAKWQPRYFVRLSRWNLSLG